MMSEASFASLGPTLLARKGGAKPAMRPQLTPLPEDVASLAALAEEQLEDLGWNDMGNDRAPGDATGSDAPVVSSKPSGKPSYGVEEFVEGDRSAEIVPLNAPLARPTAANEDIFENALDGADSPVVRSQQKRLARRVLADAASPHGHTPARARKGKRAAFTLRLDTDRHLKLRLVATMQGVSAQALVTQALDAMLSDIEELDTIVERMKRD